MQITEIWSSLSSIKSSLWLCNGDMSDLSMGAIRRYFVHDSRVRSLVGGRADSGDDRSPKNIGCTLPPLEERRKLYHKICPNSCKGSPRANQTETLSSANGIARHQTDYRYCRNKSGVDNPLSGGLFNMASPFLRILGLT